MLLNCPHRMNEVVEMLCLDVVLEIGITRSDSRNGLS